MLLDTGNYLRLARRLSDLLRDDSAPIERTWHNLAREPTSEELTDIAWWSVRFSFLRNGLMHGRLPRRRCVATRRCAPYRSRRVALRQAIEQTVANDGHDSIRGDLLWRSSVRAVREWWRAQQGAEPGAS